MFSRLAQFTRQGGCCAWSALRPASIATSRSIQLSASNIITIRTLTIVQPRCFTTLHRCTRTAASSLSHRGASVNLFPASSSGASIWRPVTIPSLAPSVSASAAAVPSPLNQCATRNYRAPKASSSPPSSPRSIPTPPPLNSTSSTSPSVLPPRLVYSNGSPFNFRFYTILNAAQSIFWTGIYALHFMHPEIPMWWGALGLGTALTFQAGLELRARRTLQEIAMYPDAQSLRFTVSNSLNRSLRFDVPFTSIGPNPRIHAPAPTSKRSVAYWPIKVEGYPAFFVVDASGTIWDLITLNRIMTYDVRTTMRPGEKLNIYVPTMQQQPQQQQRQ